MPFFAGRRLIALVLNKNEAFLRQIWYATHTRDVPKVSPARLTLKQITFHKGLIDFVCGYSFDCGLLREPYQR